MNQSVSKGLPSNSQKVFEVYNTSRSSQNQSIRSPMLMGQFNFGSGGQSQISNKNSTKLKIKNQRTFHHQLRIRPDDDTSSQKSTLTFYQSSFPNESAQVIAKQKANLNGYIHQNSRRNSGSNKKEIIDEVKQLIASKKILQVLRSNCFIKNVLRKRLRQLAIESQKKIANFIRGKYYRRLYKKGIFIGTLYLETAERFDRQQPVYVFGSFTKNPWSDRIQCFYDKFFKCYKADRIRIMIGHQFKFIVENGSKYLTSIRYPMLQDMSGNHNNFYDPTRQKQQKKINHNKITIINQRVNHPSYHESFNAQDRNHPVKYVQFDNLHDVLENERELKQIKQQNHQAIQQQSQPAVQKSDPFINKPYQDFIGSFERYYSSYQVDLDKMYQEYMNQYQEQGGPSDYLKFVNQSALDELQSLTQHANLFDMDLQEHFNELTPLKLKEKQSFVAYPDKKQQESLLSYDNRYSLKPISEVDERNRQSQYDLNEGFYTEITGDLSQTMKESSNQIDDFHSTELAIITGAFKIGKIPEQCEDAYFVTDRGFGVADGVSGWNDYGFSSSLFSNQLMDNCKIQIEQYLEQSKESEQSKQIMKKMRKSGSYLSMENLDAGEPSVSDEEILDDDSPLPKQFKDNTANGLKFDKESITLHPIFILGQAFSKVSAVGSSTAMIAIRNQKELNIANLGDSGFVLIRFRNGEAYTAARSREQQHSFNIPYQISILPGPNELEMLRQRGRIEELKKLKAILRRRDNTMCQDKPDDAEEYSFELQEGDIIVSATDGIFDNLFSHEILQIVRNFKMKHKKLYKLEQAEKLAEILVYEALDKVKDKKKKTPYQRKYKKTYNATWEGGKEDDMTALVTFAIGKNFQA